MSLYWHVSIFEMFMVPNWKQDIKDGYVYEAIDNNNLTLFKKLISGRNDTDKEVFLTKAVLYGKYTIVEYLLKEKVGMYYNLPEHYGNRFTGEGSSPCTKAMDCAMLIERYDIAELLARHGYNVNIQTGKNLPALTEAAKHCDIKGILWLLSKKAYPNIRDEKNNTSMHYLIECVDYCHKAGITGCEKKQDIIYNAMRIMIKKGMKLNIKGHNGKLPIDLATDNKVIQFIRVEIKKSRINNKRK